MIIPQDTSPLFFPQIEKDDSCSKILEPCSNDIYIITNDVHEEAIPIMKDISLPFFLMLNYGDT